MSDREDRSSSERRGKSSSAKDRSRSRSKSHRSGSRSPRSRSPRSRTPRSRSYSKSRSRSRSPSPSYSRHRRYSRSRSRSPRFRRRSPRPPPRSSRRRHYGSREDPPKSNCLGIFGLSLYTTEGELKEFLEKFGTVESCQLVFDHQSGRSRGFAFAYFPDEDEAEKVKEATSGREVDGRRIRVDYSITQRAHTPTPGVYMGKPSQFRNKKDNDRHYGRDRDECYSQRRDYSRSRSRSPRRR